jgi:hypothetical protein
VAARLLEEVAGCRYLLFTGSPRPVANVVVVRSIHETVTPWSRAGCKYLKKYVDHSDQ